MMTQPRSPLSRTLLDAPCGLSHESLIPFDLPRHTITATPEHDHEHKAMTSAAM